MAERVLIVDDDPDVSRSLCCILRTRGCVVREENDPRYALETVRDFEPDVVILDYLMPILHGGDVAWQLAEDPVWRGVRIIICSAAPAEEILKQLPPSRIPILGKPIDIEALIALIRRSGATHA